MSSSSLIFFNSDCLRFRLQTNKIRTYLIFSDKFELILVTTNILRQKYLSLSHE